MTSWLQSLIKLYALLIVISNNNIRWISKVQFYVCMCELRKMYMTAYKWTESLCKKHKHHETGQKHKPNAWMKNWEANRIVLLIMQDISLKGAIWQNSGAVREINNYRVAVIQLGHRCTSAELGLKTRHSYTCDTAGLCGEFWN